MSDKITACNKKLDGSDVIQYDVSYEVTSGDNKNQFCIAVLASEMTDPSSETEAKEKANLKAKAIKDAWVADLPNYTSEPVSSVVGDITL
jgi:hypothetical protein